MQLANAVSVARNPNLEAMEAEFTKWWEREGQFGRAGGGQYERTFAYNAWMASKRKSPVAQPMTIAQGENAGTYDPVLLDIEQSPVTVLPDGSACFTAKLPLPAEHWLYAPRGEWDSTRDDYADKPYPILPRDMAPAIREAAKYAIRGATDCGKDMDFDPDALVLNLINVLCGPSGAATAVKEGGK